MPEPRTVRRPPWQALLTLGVMLGLCLALLYPGLDQPFRGGDDWGWVRDVPRRNTLGTIFDPHLITENEGPSTYYIPLQSVVYLLFVGPWGEAGAQPLRWTLALSHLLNGALLWWLWRRILLPPPPWRSPLRLTPRDAEAASLLAAFGFLIHRANTGTVSWIGAAVSHTLQLSLFAGCAHLFLSWVRAPREQSPLRSLPWWCGAFLLAAAAALLKETAAVLGPLMGLLWLTTLARLDDERPFIERVRAEAPRGALGLAPLFGLALFIGWMQSLKYDTGYLANSWGGLAVGGRVPLRLLDLLTLGFWPMRQPRLLKLALAGSLAGLIGGTAGQIRVRPLLPGLMAAALGLILPFAIHNFRPVHTLGRYLYLPSVPLLALLALLPFALRGWARRIALTGYAAWLVWHIVLGAQAIR